MLPPPPPPHLSFEPLEILLMLLFLKRSKHEQAVCYSPVSPRDLTSINIALPLWNINVTQVIEETYINGAWLNQKLQ